MVSGTNTFGEKVTIRPLCRSRNCAAVAKVTNRVTPPVDWVSPAPHEDAYRTLVAANATPAHLPEYLFDLGLALEGMQDREHARDAFLGLARRFPDGPKARSALVRVPRTYCFVSFACSLFVYFVGGFLERPGEHQPKDRYQQSHVQQ